MKSGRGGGAKGSGPVFSISAEVTDQLLGRAVFRRFFSRAFHG